MARVKKIKTPKDPEGRMSLGDHLRELRNRLLICAVAVVIMAIGGWFLYYPVFDLLYVPFKELQDLDYNVNINIAGVAGSFETHLRLAAYLGLILATPVILYQIWAFIQLGLHQNEKRYALGFLLTAFPLFGAGILFGYFAITRAVPILMTFGPNKDIYQLVEFQGYIELVARTCLIFGAAFTYPVILVGLNLVGMLPASKMIKAWRWVIFLSFLFTAMMIPTPEPITLILVTSPFIIMFFAAYFISLIFDKRKARKQKALALNPDQASEIDLTPSSIDPVSTEQNKA